MVSADLGRLDRRRQFVHWSAADWVGLPSKGFAAFRTCGPTSNSSPDWDSSKLLRDKGSGVDYAAASA
jgi:hypothetical protein